MEQAQRGSCLVPCVCHVISYQAVYEFEGTEEEGRSIPSRSTATSWFMPRNSQHNIVHLFLFQLASYKAIAAISLWSGRKSSHMCAFQLPFILSMTGEWSWLLDFSWPNKCPYSWKVRWVRYAFSAHGLFVLVLIWRGGGKLDMICLSQQ